jgi:hypothetical protein
MLVTFKGLQGARFYQGYTFDGETPREVSDEWFERCKNPNIVAAEDKPKRKRRTKAEMAAEQEDGGTE